MSAKRQPPPPHIRLRIGVTGHRAPPKLPAQSATPLRQLLDRLFAAIAVGPGECVIVSSLAEGADRLVADAGLAAGCSLQAILPFARAEYARDFESAQSRAAFAALLAGASDVIELPGTADDRPRAYEAAGLAMLARSSVLIAIWDGERAAGTGGTAEIVDRAVSSGRLVVWIEPAKPDRIMLSGPDGFHPADVVTAARAIRDIAVAPER